MPSATPAVNISGRSGQHAPGQTAGSAIGRSVDLAQHVEKLGYTRYWLAEHHSIEGLACSATPVLIGHVAAATKTIRVGSGGVMLPNHAPLVVAEQFGTLEALYPGRIDLGLGRAPGGDFATMRALRRDLGQNGDEFPELLTELQLYLGPEQPGQKVKAIPGQNSNVPITRCWAPADLARNLRGFLDYRLRSPRISRRNICMRRCSCTASVFARANDCASRTHGRGAGDCRRNGCRSATPLHYCAAAFSPAHSQSTCRTFAAGRFDGGVVARSRTGCRGLSPAASHRGFERHREGWPQRLIADTGADEIIVVSDTYEHRDRLESFQRVAEVAATLEIKRTVAV